MDNNKLHIQFDKNNKYIGKVDSAHEIIAGHYNVEVSHDEHEDIEKNKENADHVAKFLSGKSKIDNEKRLEGLVKEGLNPDFMDDGVDINSVKDKIKKHGKNPDTIRPMETIHLGTYRSDDSGVHKYAQVHYDTLEDKYKVLGRHKGISKTHDPRFDTEDEAHAHAKAWVKNPIHEMADDLMELSKKTLADYIKNASFDVLRKSSDKATAASKTTSGIFTDDKEREQEGSRERDDIHSKMLKRTSNINKAVNKLTKEDLDESFLDKNKTFYGVFARDSSGNYSHDSTHKTRNDAQDAVQSHESKSAFHIPLSYDEAQSLNNADYSSINSLMQSKRKSGIKGTFKMNESFSAQILDSIINNKPIEAQEQFAIGLSNIIKDRIDTRRQEVAKSVFSEANESVGGCYSEPGSKKYKKFTRSGPHKVHDLSHMSDDEAYDHSQGHAKSGDVLKLSGNRSAVMLDAWPTMVHGSSEHLHSLDTENGHTWKTLDGGAWADHAAMARKVVGIK